MKYYYYISKPKVEMLLPQIKRAKFSLKLSPKVDVAGVSIGADIEKRDDSALVSRLGELIDKMEKKKLLEDVNSSMVVQEGSFLRSKSTWRHGLFFFKGGIPTSWGGSNREALLVLTVIYVAWTTIGDTIILLVGSPNNVLGDKVAPEGVFIPGTGGVQDSVQTLVNSLQTDEPIADMRMRTSFGEAFSLPNIQLGSQQRYTQEYGQYGLIPLPGFHSAELFPLSLAQFCFDYLSSLPQASLETVFRVLSIYESTQGNFQLDLEDFRSRVRDEWEDEWEKVRQAAEQNGLRRFSRVCFGSPIYTALL